MPRWSLPALLLLGACGQTANDPAAVTPAEDRQLNQAAEMLDANSVDAGAVSNESAL